MTGYLLPSGAGEVTPHGIDDPVKYMPSFVMRDFNAMGVRGFKLKTDENGQPLPPRWVGMTMKVQDNTILNIHVLRNVEEHIGGGTTDPRTKLFGKLLPQMNLLM